MQLPQLRDLVRREPKPASPFPGWVERLLSIGIVARDRLVVRRQRFVNIAAAVTAGNALSHLIINSLYNFRGLLIVDIYNLLIGCASLAVPCLHRRGDNLAAIVLIMLILWGNLFAVWALGTASNLHVYFTLAGAMLFMLGVENWRLFVVLFGMFLAVLIIVLAYAPVEGFVIPQDEEFRKMLSQQAMINMIVINAAVIFYAMSAIRRAEIEIEHQYERSEALIATVLPSAIATRLKSGEEERIADRIEMLSVMFADLVGFTAAAHDLSPDEVVEFLDGLVRSFDDLCDQHGVEKIKTIGDGYMAAAGFGSDGLEGAVAVGRLALAFIMAVERQPPLGGVKLELRIGIHCGPATAGVIGNMRVSYDIWGDAVNVASRMESHGLAGRIQVSGAYRQLADASFDFEERGPTDIKGVGLAQTYFLVGNRHSS